MHAKNRTKLKTLDKVAADKRCAGIYEDSDGIWVDLAPGYNFDGQSSIRGDTVRNVLDDWSLVVAGEPY